jgi:large subunit ribosomal protein L9
MKVMLLKDVYKLGRAGDVKKVADGYGRNYLLPQGLAVLASPGALKQAERIRHSAGEERARLNQELGTVADQLEGLTLTFPVKAGETGKLYGSITTAMMAEAIEAARGLTIDRRQIDSQPIKTIGAHTAAIRLTVDLVPEIRIIVHREGEPPESAFEAQPDEGLGDFDELVAELDEQPEEDEDLAGLEPAEVDAQVDLEPAEVDARVDLEPAEDEAQAELEPVGDVEPQAWEGEAPADEFDTQPD